MFSIFSTHVLPAHVKRYLTDFAEVTEWNKGIPIDSDELARAAAHADGIITPGGTPFGEALIQQLPKLRAISTISVGYDHFDPAAFRRHNIMATHTPEVLDETVADLTFALMLSVARRIAELDKLVRDGRWGEQPGSASFGIDVHHRTLGIVGMGRIGEAVAKRAKHGFGMNVLYHNRTRKPAVEQELGATYVSFEELLEIADFVVLLTPLTPATKGLMDAQAFARMKSSAIFINVSRGATVDEQALYEALSTGAIYGAGLDVFQEEPVPVDHPLLSLRNVVLVPHIGSATAKTREDMAMLAAQNLIAVLEGRARDAKVIPELQDIVKES
ncbi:2-hydroxyacid dehydrogenase [Alicyclobacillus fodiniaquatilis]|uniref:2-hydroxyacid dehydrogenase n=1 Tax=Alicyclobacillus fodiniaquatilis TaxID=1661150 RepID=A0ABW4JKT8_9BACL